MNFRIDPERYPNRTKIQFATSAAMPALVHRACLATGLPSNTVYVQHAVVDALVRDLGLDRDELLADLPAPRGPGMYQHRRASMGNLVGTPVRTGPANTDEEVR